MAAGDGTRLKSRLPKVLHTVAGRPLLVHVLDALDGLDLDRIVVVASTRRAEVEDAIGQRRRVEYAVQDPPAGTGDAVRVGLEALGDAQRVLIVPGDAPLLTTETLQRMIDAHADGSAALTLLTTHVVGHSGSGRIVREGDAVRRVVEERDADDATLAISEINAGAYVADVERLRAVLPKIGSDNAQREFYFTDAIGFLADEGDSVAVVTTDADEVQGVNSRADLAAAGALFRKRTNDRWLAAGVSLLDPATTYIDASVEIGADVVIRPFTFLEGTTRVADGADIGPNARVVDSEIGPDAQISYAVVRSSVIGEAASVGPFASLRPGTRVGKGARVGTFVETKDSSLGDGSKANHLAYLGDAEIGTGVNVGAGTITCNWDGQDKHKTVIEDDAYIGSDTMLVAPVRIGKRGATGAGAVVRDDVPEDGLAVGVPARVIEGKGDKMARKGRQPEPDAGG